MTVLAKARLGSCGHLPRLVSTLAGSRLKVCWAKGAVREQAGQPPAVPRAVGLCLGMRGLVLVPAQLAASIRSPSDPNGTI